MYRKEESTPIPAESFELPFEGKLSSDNRWVIMPDLIPWTELVHSTADIYNTGSSSIFSEMTFFTRAAMASALAASPSMLLISASK